MHLSIYYLVGQECHKLATCDSWQQTVTDMQQIGFVRSSSETEPYQVTHPEPQIRPQQTKSRPIRENITVGCCLCLLEQNIY